MAKTLPIANILILNLTLKAMVKIEIKLNGTPTSAGIIKLFLISRYELKNVG